MPPADLTCHPTILITCPVCCLHSLLYQNHNTGAPTDKRTNIAKEIESTEVSYLKALDLFRDIYVKKFRENHSLGVPEADIKIIFSGDIDVICGYSKTLCELFGERIGGGAKWNNASSRIGDVFVRIADFLKTYEFWLFSLPNNQTDDDAFRYQAFIRNYAIVMQALGKCTKKSQDFASLLSECDADPRNSLKTIDAYLIMPIQRVPRYILLLKVRWYKPSIERFGLLNFVVIGIDQTNSSCSY